MKADHTVQAVALAALLVAAGCASQSSETATTGSPPGSVVTTSETAIAPTSTYVTLRTVQGKWGEAITADAGEITVDAPLPDPGGKVLHAGDKIVYCMVSLRNTGSTSLSYDQADFYLNAPNEAWGGGYGGAATVLEPPLGAGTLEPGGTARGAVSFEFTRAEAVDSLWLYFVVSWKKTITAVWR